LLRRRGKVRVEARHLSASQAEKKGYKLRARCRRGGEMVALNAIAQTAALARLRLRKRDQRRKPSQLTRDRVDAYRV
jgi:hypothetical protein